MNIHENQSLSAECRLQNLGESFQLLSTIQVDFYS
jgi:hypothetical protein